MNLTLETIEQLRREMKRSAVKPNIVGNRTEAKRLNRIERAISVSFPGYTRHKWRVGDKYYLTAYFAGHRCFYVPAVGGG